MRLFFTLTFLLLLGLSALAWRIQPRPADPSKTLLAWASDDNPQRPRQIKLFKEAHPDCELILDPNNTGLEKVVVQSLAGVGPDLFDMGGGALPVLIHADIVWDVTDELKKRGVDVARDVWKGVQHLAIQDGRVYGVPSNAAANALFINKDLFDKAGLPYPAGPWTWNEFLPLAQKLTLRDAKGRPRQFGLLCDWWLWPNFVLQWGGRIYTEDGTRCVVDSPEAIAGIQFLHDLIYKYRVMPGPVEEAAMATQGGWGAGTITQFGGGKAAMALGGRWWLCTLRKKDQFPGLRMTVAECPYRDKPIYYAYGRATLISKHSPRRAQALKFLLYMMGADYNQCINDQADALAPVKRFSYGPAYLHNPEFPEEDRNAIWRTMMEKAVPTPPSPFVNAQLADRILNKQLDLVKSDAKPVADALRDAAREVNAQIQKTLARNPALKRKYDALAARSAGVYEAGR